jgi:hypothetical protein
LAGVGIAGALDGVAEDADDTDDLPSFPNAVGDVAGVTDQLLAACHL